MQHPRRGRRSRGPLHHPPPAVGGRAAVPGQLHHLRHLLHAALGRPGAAARRPPAEPRAGRADPPQPRARRARGTAVLALHEGPGPALRLRLQLPEQHLRSRSRSSTGCRRRSRWRRRGGHLAASGHRGRHHLRGHGAGRCSTGDDGRCARRDLGARLLARAGRPLPVLRTTSASSRCLLPGRRQLRAVLAGPVALVPVAAHAVVRAGGCVRGLLRPAAARQPDRGDVRGLHPHRAREGPPRAARGLPARRCAARSRRS